MMTPQVNVRALLMAIDAVGGPGAALAVNTIYMALDKQEKELMRVFERQMEVKDEATFQAGFETGYKAAEQAFYSTTQPAIQLPDQSPEHDAHVANAVAALEAPEFYEGDSGDEDRNA